MENAKEIKDLIDFEKNVEIMEVEKTDFDFNGYYFCEDTETPEVYAERQEELSELDRFNNTFITEQLQADLLRTFDICRCHMGEFMQKHERRRALLNVPQNQYRPELDKEDIDSCRFGVVLLSERGKYVGISSVVRECKTCHKIEYYGDSSVFTRIVAEATVNFFNNKQAEEEMNAAVDPDVVDIDINDDDDVVFEDLGTGDVVHSTEVESKIISVEEEFAEENK